MRRLEQRGATWAARGAVDRPGLGIDRDRARPDVDAARAQPAPATAAAPAGSPPVRRRAGSGSPCSDQTLQSAPGVVRPAATLPSRTGAASSHQRHAGGAARSECGLDSWRAAACATRARRPVPPRRGDRLRRRRQEGCRLGSPPTQEPTARPAAWPAERGRSRTLPRSMRRGRARWRRGTGRPVRCAPPRGSAGSGRRWAKCRGKQSRTSAQV